MNVYKSPVYPALMARLPGPNRRSLKAAGGYFNVPDEDVEAFEAFIAMRPQYRISRVDPTVAGGSTDGVTETVIPASPDGIVVRPEPMSASEQHPGTAGVEESLDQLHVPELRDRLEGLGLPTEGNKAALVQRLAEATASPNGANDPDVDSEDDEEEIPDAFGDDDDQG